MYCNHKNIKIKGNEETGFKGAECEDCGLPLTRYILKDDVGSSSYQYIPNWDEIESFFHVVIHDHDAASGYALEMVGKLIRIDHEARRNTVKKEHLIPIQQISNEQLAYTSFGTYEPQFTGYIALPNILIHSKKPGMGFTGVQLMVFCNGTAIAFDRCWKYDYSTINGTIDGKARRNRKNKQNEMTVRFFLLGCKHEYKEVSGKEVGLNLFPMEHARKCKKCGHTYVVDTSD